MSSAAAALLCLVVGVTDGDTLKVRCGSGEQQTVRLAEVDAPEKRQAFGARAKQALSDHTYKQTISLRVTGKDRYGRLIAHVDLAGINVNFALVQQGMAWCYEQYLTQVDACLRLQREAEAAGRGLWGDPTPVAPWDFRKIQRQPSEAGARRT